MTGGRDWDEWLSDYSFVPDKQVFRRIRGAPKYEVFTGSKPLAILWLAPIAAGAGALGGVAVSGALWAKLWQLPIWLVATLFSLVAARKAAFAVSKQPIAFYTGWCSFWGLLIGAVAMWGGQLEGAGWAYGVAGGMGFIVAITHGSYEPDDIQSRDAFFGLSMLFGPASACLAAWLYRNRLDPTIEDAALAGGIAGLLFLIPPIAYLLGTLDNRTGLRRLGALLLHRDEKLGNATRVLSQGIRLWPQDDSFYVLRGLAHGLAGRVDEAEQDWSKHRELAPKSHVSHAARGWVALRRGDPDEAAKQFSLAISGKKADNWALVGLGAALLRQNNPDEALAALQRIKSADHGPLSLTWLAEAQLRSGNPEAAIRSASDAIEEMDSPHGRSFFVRAEALRALGHIDEAALDYNRAVQNADEEGLDDLAIAGLDAIDRPLEEEELDW